MNLSDKWLKHIPENPHNTQDELYREVNTAAANIFLGGVVTDGAVVIRAAILAERERCAEIAKSHFLETSYRLSSPPQSTAAHLILEQIRSGK